MATIQSVNRGRPKTLVRQQVLDVATKVYWEQGPERVSLSEVCVNAQVSRPSLYREFGNEDGLLAASLMNYHERVFKPFFKILADIGPMEQVLTKFVDKMTGGTGPRGHPDGCLLVKTRSAIDSVGPQSRAAAIEIHDWKIASYTSWLEDCQANGSLKNKQEAGFLAAYLDAQLNLTMVRDARGDDRELSRRILWLALRQLS